MNAFDGGLPTDIARIDADSRLIEAGPRFAQLNAQAGGGIGAPLALPAVAIIARLAQRLGIVVARPAIVADGEDDVELWVRAAPDADGVALEVSGWQIRDASPPPATDTQGAFDAAEADFWWESDAAMCLTGMPADPAVLLGVDTQGLLGAPLTRFLALDDGEEGMLPILTAAANREGFDDQPATIRATGRRVRISAVARRDALGRFAGFLGAGRFVELTGLPAPAQASDDDPAFSDAFSLRLERALRGPLARIVAHADSIGGQSDGPVKPEYVEYAHDIASAARHLMGLVDDLVDLQAIERPDFRVEPEPIDLADVARRAGGLLAVRASNADVRIDRPDFAETLPANGEFRRALQILVNLVGNAVRYSPPGGMVWLRLEREGEMARVVVADQGKGIALTDQRRIFDKFGRVDPSEPGGTGLGLYIARRLARAMGGELSVESAPGQGARFVLELPAGK